MPDLYALEKSRWAFEVLLGLGYASFLAATVREIFRFWGNRGKPGA